MGGRLHAVRAGFPGSPQATPRKHRGITVKAGMTASKKSSTSSHTDTPQGRSTAGLAAQPMQQLFESWLGAWRSFADPARAAAGDAPSPSPSPFAAFQPPQPFAFAMPAMPPMPPMPDWSGAAASFAGLAPVASVPPARLQKLQADYSRDCLALIQQASAATPTVPELKDRRFSADAWKASPAHGFRGRLVSAERALHAGARRRARDRPEDARADPLSRSSSGRPPRRRATSSRSIRRRRRISSRRRARACVSG